MTTIYFMRHSKPIGYETTDSLQLQNEKSILTVEGEKLAERISKIDEFKDFDKVITSNYVRAMATAKYFSDSLIIDEAFGERKFGVDLYSDLPEQFEVKQFTNYDFKMPNGESLNEVLKREETALNDVLYKYKDKKILIVSHATAMATLFSKWCDMTFESYKFNGKEFFDGKWNYCEIFKLVFDENNSLISIENKRL